MKRLLHTVLFMIMAMLYSCSNFMDLEPKDKVSSDMLFSDPQGVQLYMANLYSQLPIEDFNFTPHIGFNTAAVNNSMLSVLQPGMFTDESVHSSWANFCSSNDYNWWESGYKLIRDINILSDAIDGLDISAELKTQMHGETAFLKAYSYFALAKRYGGLPLINEVQEWTGDIESLKVPRSTEKDTYDFILSLCDDAIKYLPESFVGADRRANRYVAMALKSRVALYAGSLAKYWMNSPLSGDAVDQKLVGIDASEANRYYELCIDAAEMLITSGKYSLYKPNPTNPEEAADNYQQIFETPSIASCENIFIKGFGMIDNPLTSHNYDIWYTPNQTKGSWPHPGRLNPTLDLVDSYESYYNPGESAPIVTTEDGDISDVNGFNLTTKYLHFDNPTDIFKGKDARFFASINYPFGDWKNVKLIIQAGIIKPDGSALIKTKSSYEAADGTIYYTYGAQNNSQYSGFDTEGANYTRTGFLMKKFLQEKADVTTYWYKSTTDWIEMRYAEVLLNYAEAVVESGYTANDAQKKAAEALNSIRRRAGHTVDIPLTLENVLRERKVELAFENSRAWDLIRRREYHIEFNNRIRIALLPILDLRGAKPQYIFVREKIQNEFSKTFEPKLYYKPIPGIATTGIVQNPQY